MLSNDILNADGSLNRTALREQIFSNEENKQWLNQLLHPIIRSSMLAQLNDAAGPYTILVAPLLFENKLESLVERTLVVDVPVEKQISRTLNRDQHSSEQVIKNIIDSQIARTERLSKADDIIDNSNATLEELTAKVKLAHPQQGRHIGELNALIHLARLERAAVGDDQDFGTGFG